MMIQQRLNVKDKSDIRGREHLAIIFLFVFVLFGPPGVTGGSYMTCIMKICPSFRLTRHFIGIASITFCKFWDVVSNPHEGFFTKNVYYLLFCCANPISGKNMFSKYRPKYSQTIRQQNFRINYTSRTK